VYQGHGVHSQALRWGSGEGVGSMIHIVHHTYVHAFHVSPEERFPDVQGPGECSLHPMPQSKDSNHAPHWIDVECLMQGCIRSADDHRRRGIPPRPGLEFFSGNIVPPPPHGPVL